MSIRTHASLAAIAVLSLLVAGCASASIDPGASDGGIGFDPPGAIPASGEVLGTGTVLQAEDEPAMFCLGAVAESYPPQCSGPEISNWDWQSVDGYESASGTTWGSYALQGEWDGTVFRVTQPPIMLALYDPMVHPDPLEDPANAGETGEQELHELQEQLIADPELAPLGLWAANGYLFVTVLYDDGRLQAHVDSSYGDNVVVIRSALRSVD